MYKYIYIYMYIMESSACCTRSACFIAFTCTCTTQEVGVGCYVFFSYIVKYIVKCQWALCGWLPGHC